MSKKADLVLYNGKIHTGDTSNPHATAVAISDGRFVAVGDDKNILQQYGVEDVLQIDLKGKRVIPGLNDSHIHLIRGGLNYNLELRWDGVPSLSDALSMLRKQVAITPAPQWVRVVGGWTEHQFAEKRMPTLDEINEIAPDTPVFIMHLYDRAFLNRAALRAVGFTKDTPAPPGGVIEKNSKGEPTGLMLASPNAMILYSTLAKGPKLSYEYQVNSTRHFMTELNRFGITSVIDAGGGFQNFPDDYQVISELHQKQQLTVRIAYNLFTQRPKQELEDFRNWTGTVKLHQGDNMYRHNGAGEMLVFSAADFEDFLQPRPDLPETMEAELEKVVRHLVENRWPFRLHATYNESITRFLNVFEKVNRDIPFDGLHWIFDHAETIDERNIDRVKALGGGIAIQSRMAFQGEYFTDRYGKAAAAQTPPVKRMLQAGVPVGAGTDATRVSSYNPWVTLYWLSAGKTVGGQQLYDDNTKLSRETALELYTRGSAWFSGEQDIKGSIKADQLADLAVLDTDFFTIPEDEIKHIESVLTVVGGKIVYGSDDFSRFSPAPIPVLPDWSPISQFGGYYSGSNISKAKTNTATRQDSAIADQIHCCAGSCDVHGHDHNTARLSNIPVNNYTAFWGIFGCSCFAF